MSFSSSVKDDVSRIDTYDECCIIAEFIGIIRVSGLLTFTHETENIKITTENASIARRIFILAKDVLQINPEIIIRKGRKLKKHNIYMILLPNKKTFREVADKIYGFDSIKDIKQFLHKECCKKAYLRGAFLGGGSVSNPEKTYHLEIVTYAKKTASEIMNTMGSFNINAKLIKRNKNHIVYIKDGEHIADFLKVIGAHAALLKFENVRILKEMRNNVNRAVNCETANLEKTVQASLRQIEKIKLIIDCIGFDKLPQGLKQVAELRLEHTDASLKEIGEMIDPPISKSGVNHRLRKIEKMADELQ